MRRVRARFKRRSRPSISSAVSFGISARSRSGHDFSRVLEVMSPRKNRSTRSVTRIFLTMPVLLPSFRDSFPAVLAVKVSLRRGSAATLTAAGCGESVPLRREGSQENVLGCSWPHLTERQLPLKKMFHKTDIKPLLLQPFFHGLTENFWAIALQNVMEAIDIRPPSPGPTMHQLGQIAKRGFS